MTRIPCFLLEDAQRTRRSLRRYTPSEGSCSQSYHEAMVTLDEVPDDEALKSADGYLIIGDTWPHDDPRWPTQCEHCSYHFTDADTRQLFQEKLFQRADTEELVTLRDAHKLPGAMYRASWYKAICSSQDDGDPLVVITPGGAWCVDMQASNCTLSDDQHQDRHHCWVRHGVAPLITVDKNGVTCQAGAGSILAGSYHGFLRNGALED